MGKVILTLASNLEDLKLGVLKNIKEKSDWENIIIVPDRFSLLVELAAFEQIDQDCLFNTQVMPITRFVSFFLEQIGIKKQKVSTEEQSFLVRRAMQKVSDQFVCLSSRVSPQLTQEIAKNIAQLKSCCISSADLKIEHIHPNIAGKFADIKLIYEQYEQLLGEQVDGSNMLELFEKNIGNMPMLANVNLFFVGFYSFTSQVFQIIKSLIPHTNQIVVGAFYHFEKNNKRVFETDIYDKMMTLSGLPEFEVQTPPSTLNSNQIHVLQNVFSNKIKTIKSDFVQVLNAESQKQEIDFVVADILKNIKQNNMRFGDFAIAHGNLQSAKEELEIAFEKHKINYYIDTSQSLGQTSFAAFVLGFLKMCLTGFEKSALKNFFCSMFLPLSMQEKSQILVLIEKYCIEKQNFLLQNTQFLPEDKENAQTFVQQSNKIINVYNQIKKCNTVGQYIEFLQKFLTEFDAKNTLEQKAAQLGQSGQIKLQKLYVQLFDKAQECFESLNKYLADEVVDTKQFLDILQNCFDNKKISTVPIFGDCVFVGDATDSFFGSVKVLYVLAANAANLPKTIGDTGFINDDNIAQVANIVSINPTIRAINKRNKFKLLNLLATPKQKLIVTYQSVGEDGKEALPSSFVGDLCKAFEVEIEPIAKTVRLATDSFESQVDQVCQKVFSPHSAKEFLFRHAATGVFNQQVINSVYGVLQKHGFVDQQQMQLFWQNQKMPQIANARELFFAKNKTKVSQLEKYFESPFKHFVVYGLGLKEEQTADIQKFDIGNYLHFVAEQFLAKIKNNSFEKQNIDKLVEQITKSAKHKKEFYKFNLNTHNKALLAYLEVEANSLCHLIYSNIQKSNFKPNVLEQSFFVKDYFEKQNISLSGRIDRMDEFENMFTIIDYKTGQAKLNASLLYVGKKLQLLIYADVVEKQTGKSCAGVFYFSVKNNFDEQSDGKMRGMFKKDEYVIFNLDNTLNQENPTSTLISAKLNKDKGGGVEFSKDTGTQYLNQMIQYARQLCEKAIDQMLEGHIDFVEQEKADIFENPMFEQIRPATFKAKDQDIAQIVENNNG
jgi:ATP-dependent helicase/nuclease subunit B